MFALRRIISRPVLSVSGVQARRFHAGRYQFAAADPPNITEMMMNDPKLRDMFEKLGRHPPAVAALQKIGDIIQGKGFDTTKPPSKMGMVKLMMDKEFREAMQNLSTEMQNAGVEITPDVLGKIMESNKGK